MEQKDQKIEDDLGQMSIEQLVKELEGIVERLESDDTTLEESLEMYERGAKVREACQRKLTSYERRVEQLLCENGRISIEPFE
jgi:exodeoxyribonuclease VII small subunit